LQVFAFCSYQEAMAKSRKDRETAQAREALAAQRIWPMWVRNLGAMIEAEVIVRFACDPCRRVYDVDLASLAMLRGREWSLIGRGARCKASRCRARGRFVAAINRETPFLCLGGDMPTWLIGARPKEHEAPPEGPGGPDRPNGGGDPPAPRGVDPVRWSQADLAERKRMVRRARD
jgi:hypothetical protein